MKQISTLNRFHAGIWGGISRDHWQESQHWWISWRLYFQHVPNKMSSPMAKFLYEVHSSLLATSTIVAMTWLQFDPHLICQMKSRNRRRYFSLQVHWQIMWFRCIFEMKCLCKMCTLTLSPVSSRRWQCLLFNPSCTRKPIPRRQWSAIIRRWFPIFRTGKKKIPEQLMQSAAWYKILWPVHVLIQDMVVHPPRTRRKKTLDLQKYKM